VRLVLYFINDSIEVTAFFRMFSLYTRTSQDISFDLSVAESEPSKTLLESDSAFDLAMNLFNFGLAKSTLVLGRHFGSHRKTS